MKDNDTPGSNRSYMTIPPTMMDPDTHEELDKLQKPILKASNRSRRFQTTLNYLHMILRLLIYIRDLQNLNFQ